MKTIVVTGSSGLIGSEVVKTFASGPWKVIGIDNDMRKYFFGPGASTEWMRIGQIKEYQNFESKFIDIRDKESIFNLFSDYGADIDAVVHCAAQPSHDWAAREPSTDFNINAVGTLHLLEAMRTYSPKASFVFTSTNKVYGDTPNLLPLIELESRWEVSEQHAFFQNGIDESMTIDQSLHSVFGASKVAADVLVQEYGRYFGLNTVVFRGGCLTGGAHSGAELHGFLSYLAKCALTGSKYVVFGHKGKQVRDNIHSSDLVSAFEAFMKKPRAGMVYNIGGGRKSNCSVLEAIARMEELVGKKMNYQISTEARKGDHIWWITDTNKFESDYPEWNQNYDTGLVIQDVLTGVEKQLSNAK